MGLGGGGNGAEGLGGGDKRFEMGFFKTALDIFAERRFVSSCLRISSPSLIYSAKSFTVRSVWGNIVATHRTSNVTPRDV